MNRLRHALCAALIVVVAAGCSSAAAAPTPQLVYITPGPVAAAPTPQIIYVTPEPDAASPTPMPTPEATAVPTVEPTAKPLRAFSRVVADAEKIPYKTLFRNSDTYLGHTIYFRGEVIQVLDGGDGSYDLRVNVTKGSYGFWDDTVYLLYTGPRVLEDDMIQFVGEYLGPYTYESTMGASITIPQVQVHRLEVD